MSKAHSKVCMVMMMLMMILIVYGGNKQNLSSSLLFVKKRKNLDSTPIMSVMKNNSGVVTIKFYFDRQSFL